MSSAKKDRRSGENQVERERRQGRDRRRYQRILVDLEVDYRCEDTFLFAYITDLSELGIFIRTNNPEPPGTHLNLRFTLPGDEKPLEIEGEVIWINPFRPGAFDNINPGMGVRFNELTKELKQKLMRLVRKIAYLDEETASDEQDEQASADDADAAAEGDEDDGPEDDDEERDDTEIPVAVDTKHLKS